MKPEVKESIGGYTFVWPDLTIKVSRIRVHASDGRVTGELLISSPLEEGRPIYPQTTFNFNSDQTRNRLIKTLGEQDSRFAWAEVLNNVSISVVERARQGEPVQELWSDEEGERPKWLLDPILYSGLPTIVFGEKAVCKSTLALAFYTCLSLPWEDNPLGLVAPTRSVKCLLLDYEVDANVAQNNFRRFCQGMNLDRFPLFYRRCSLPLADDLEQIAHHLATIEAEVLILDSIGPAVGGDLKDAGEALRFTTGLRQLKVASILIGQVSKGDNNQQGGARRSVFGSTFFEYYARNIFEIRKVQEEDSDELDIALYNTFNNLGRRHAPLGFHVSFNGVGTKIMAVEVTQDELVARAGESYRIWQRIKQGPCTATQLVEELQVKRGTVDKALKRFKDKELVVKRGDLWARTYHEK